MVCNVRLPSRRGGWRSRERGAVGRRAAVRGFHGALDQVVSKDSKWFLRCYGLAAWWTLTLLSLFVCRIAYAAPSIEINGNYAATSGGVDYKGYMVVDCPNEYIATLVLIDEYSSLVQIDSEVYAKLMSERHGGRFYELLQEWQKVGTADGVNEYWPSWAGSLLYQEGIVTVYGYGRVWGCAVTDALIDGAKEDFNTILDGGVIGGGSSDGNVSVSDEYVDFFLEPYAEGQYANSDLQKIKYIRITRSAYDKFETRLSENSGYKYYGYVAPRLTTLFIYKSDGIRWNDANYTNPYSFSFTSYGTAWNVIGNSRHTDDEGNDYVLCNSENIGQVSIGIYDDGNYPIQMIYDGTYEGGSGGGSDEPVPDPPTQPTDPVAPTPNPPTPPTITPPSSPTPPTITPYNPTNPSPPTNTTPPSGTTPTDYTPWLQAILQQLVNLTSYLETCFTWLGTALEEHCQHIRDHMTTCSQFIGDYVVSGMSSLLGEHHSFLNGLAQWIVDNLRWENSGGEFDDSNMIYWLRRIYARQGSGDVNSRPVDPATDYSGFAGWLGVLYDAVALDVSDTSLVSLTSSLSGLQHTFPFSLPWDIKQVLQALDVSPVTPSASFTIPKWGYVEGSFTIDAEPYNRYTYDIDLHWMDSAMVSVRAFELLVFIVYVMVHTKDLFGYLMGE